MFMTAGTSGTCKKKMIIGYTSYVNTGRKNVYHLFRIACRSGRRPAKGLSHQGTAFFLRIKISMRTLFERGRGIKQAEGKANGSPAADELTDC